MPPDEQESVLQLVFPVLLHILQIEEGGGD